ncbi:MAG: hypothetical protein K8R48_07180 [Alphaproteobacteria bacterium]|nr:hypothetical protein [Alphaproteobacteria bacterium]
MPWLKKHHALKKQIREQGLNVPGQGFVQQVTALYESRIATAFSIPGDEERYMSLQNLREEMRGYIDENNRLLERKAEMNAAEKNAPLAIGAFTLVAMAVTSVAFFAITGGLSIPLSEFAFGMAGVGELLAVAGVITLATDKKQPNHFEKLASDENAALGGLSNKVQQEMDVIAAQSPAQAFLQSIKASSLTELDGMKSRLLNTFKTAAVEQVNSSNNNAPTEKFPAIRR